MSESMGDFWIRKYAEWKRNGGECPMCGHGHPGENDNQRFTVIGFCGGDYAGIYDRGQKLDVSRYTERNNLSREQLERIADQLNALYAKGEEPTP